VADATDDRDSLQLHELEMTPTLPQHLDGVKLQLMRHDALPGHHTLLQRVDLALGDGSGTASKPHYSVNARLATAFSRTPAGGDRGAVRSRR
jgi:hypothetical protein